MKKNQNPMGWFQENIHFVSYLKPMIYALLFSIAFNFVFQNLMAAGLPGWLRDSLEIISISLYGLSWYFVSTLVFKRKRGTLSLQKCAIVLIWFLFWSVLDLCVLEPVYIQALYYQAPAILLLLIQLAAAACIIFFVPCSILLFKALYENETGIPQIAKGVAESIRKHPAAILNSWLLLFFLQLIWNSLFYGPLGLQSGFNAVFLFSSLLTLSNPTAFAMLLLNITGLSVTSAYASLIVLCILFGLLVNFLDMNLISWIGNRTVFTDGKPQSKQKMGLK